MQTNLSLQPTGAVQGTAGQQTAAAAQQSPVQRAGPQGPTAGSSAVVGGPKATIPAFVNGIWPVIDPHKLTINILHFVH